MSPSSSRADHTRVCLSLETMVKHVKKPGLQGICWCLGCQGASTSTNMKATALLLLSMVFLSSARAQFGYDDDYGEGEDEGGKP